jgi:hypothetical protein
MTLVERWIWLKARVRLFLGTNSVLNGVYMLTYRFREPVMMALPSGPAHCAGLRETKGNDSSVSTSGYRYRHSLEIRCLQ